MPPSKFFKVAGYVFLAWWSELAGTWRWLSGCAHAVKLRVEKREETGNSNATPAGTLQPRPELGGPEPSWARGQACSNLSTRAPFAEALQRILTLGF